MATLLYRLGRASFRRWPIVLALWLVAVIVVGTAAATLAKPTTDTFSIPGIPSEEAADLQQELFPQATDAFDQATGAVALAAGLALLAAGAWVGRINRMDGRVQQGA